MVKRYQTVVETDLAIRQFEIIYRAAREFGFDEILKVVAPVTETTAEREGQVRFFEQFAARHQSVQHVPGTDVALRTARRTGLALPDRKSTRLNSSHQIISYAVFCLKNKTPP